MKKHQLTLGSWVSMACLAVCASTAYAQGAPPGPHGPGQEMQRQKPKDDGKPGAAPERRGPPEMMPGARPHPGMGGPAERMRENMERHEMMHGRDASVPPPFARMGDAGVRHRHRPVLTPEQIAKRQEQVKQVREKFGTELLRHHDAKTELGAHAWRIARLQRMRTLAEEQKKPKVVERIDALIKKENERHQKRMERLRGGDAGTPMMHHEPMQPAKNEHKTGGQP